MFLFLSSSFTKLLYEEVQMCLKFTGKLYDASQGKAIRTMFRGSLVEKQQTPSNGEPLKLVVQIMAGTTHQ